MISYTTIKLKLTQKGTSLNTRCCSLVQGVSSIKLTQLCLLALSMFTLLVLSACSYSGHLVLQGEVARIKLIHYDNPDTGFARNTFGLAIGFSRYQDFDRQLVQVLEYLDKEQFEDFLTVTYDHSVFGHVAGRPNSPNGLAVMVQYESGAFDIISSNFTAHYQADGRFDAYALSWWGIEEVIHQHFETDISWFLRRIPPSADDFSRFMAGESFEIVDYSDEVEDNSNIRRKVRAYFPPDHQDVGNYIEFVRFWGSDRVINAFEGHREDILANMGSNHTTHEEQISNRQIIQVYSRGRYYHIKRVSDVVVSVRSIHEEYGEWIESLFEYLFPVDTIDESDGD